MNGQEEKYGLRGWIGEGVGQIGDGGAVSTVVPERCPTCYASYRGNLYTRCTHGGSHSQVCECTDPWHDQKEVIANEGRDLQRSSPIPNSAVAGDAHPTQTRDLEDVASKTYANLKEGFRRGFMKLEPAPHVINRHLCSGHADWWKHRPIEPKMNCVICEFIADKSATREPTATLTAEQFWNEWRESASTKDVFATRCVDDASSLYWKIIKSFAQAYAAHVTAALREERDRIDQFRVAAETEVDLLEKQAEQAEQKRDQLKRQLEEFTPEDVREMAYNANALLEQERDRLRERVRQLEQDNNPQEIERSRNADRFSREGY